MVGRTVHARLSRTTHVLDYRRVGQCVFRDSAHAAIRHTLRDMTQQHTKFALAVIWMLGIVVAIAISGYLRSAPGVLLLAVIATAPPAAMWLWWNEPAQTASQRVQTVHGNGIGKRPRF
jgi:hypothetical protein